MLLPYDEKIHDLLKDHLKEIREYAHLTAEQLGTLIGVTRQSINNMESGRTPITKCTCIALCAVLDGLSEHDPMLRLQIEKLIYETYGF